MKCDHCGHPLSAHYPVPTGCTKSMWGGMCEVRCRVFVWPKKGVTR